jgi:hypothetical protein
MTLAAHPRARSGHATQRGDRLLRLDLLHEAEHGIQDDDGDDGNGLHCLPEKAGDDAGGNEDPDQETAELAEQDGKGARRFHFMDFVRPVGGAAPGRLRRGQAGGCDAQMVQHIRCRQAVPERSGWLGGTGPG